MSKIESILNINSLNNMRMVKEMYKLAEIKIRYIVMLLLLSGVVFDSLINLSSLSNNTFWREILMGYFSSFIMLAFLLFVFWKKCLCFSEIIGTFDSRNLPFSLEVVFFNIIASYSTIYIIFYPLSFVYPSYINEWLSSGPIVFYASEGGYPFLPNFLIAILVVIFTPIIEEVVFRGILVNRLCVTFSTKTAIIISSILFGILHTNSLGAIIFGVMMAIIYIRTERLVIPIICHSLNNLVAYILVAGSTIYDTQTSYGISEFQDSWMLGVLTTATFVVLSLIYLKRGQLYNKLYALTN